MQRINLFPNPVFAGPLTDIAHWGDANGTVRDNALHVTGQNGGYGFNVTVPIQRSARLVDESGRQRRQRRGHSDHTDI